MTYDPNNIFARILRHEIPANIIYENEYVLAFKDINPKAPVHILVIPKGAYVTMNDFTAIASDAEILAFNRAIGKIATDIGIAETGYRLVTNNGAHSHQEVPHLHVHILGGKPLTSF